MCHMIGMTYNTNNCFFNRWPFIPWPDITDVLGKAWNNVSQSIVHLKWVTGCGVRTELFAVSLFILASEARESFNSGDVPAGGNSFDRDLPSMSPLLHGA